MLSELVGKKITGLKVSDDKETIVFVTPDQEIWYVANGECCSSSWIEHINGYLNLMGQVVERCEESEGPAYTSDGDLIQIYRDILKLSDKSTFEIEYRNSSNGYYGGSLDLSVPSRGTSLTNLIGDF